MKYQYREIGEGDWANCDYNWYVYCQKSALHDARIIDAGCGMKPDGGYECNCGECNI